MSDAPQGPTVFNDRYELHRKLARGGMADVYLARDLLLDRPVAVKVLFPEYALDPTFVERFRREAKAAANLNHPNIVAVYDWGEQVGTYFIVMEYVEGRPLSEIIRSEGPVHPLRAAEVTSDVAAALAFAHRNGVVHRDIKPGNILITSQGQVKVTDFGIAQAVSAGPAEANLTQAGAVMGTATYFSPEQAQGRPVDPRSDLYSLGCVLYEMLTTRPPFTGDSPLAIAYKHVQEMPPAPSSINPDVPAALEAVDLRLLAKSPAQRYASADDLRADLRRYLDGRPVEAASPADDVTRAVPHAVVAGGAAAGLPPADDAPPLAEAGPGGRSRALVAVLIVLLVALAGVLVFLGVQLNKGGDVAIPTVTNLTQKDATDRLEGDGFKVVANHEVNTERPAGTVIRQDPPGGSKAAKGATVTIWVSDGMGLAPVPDVVGKTDQVARNLITQAGFTPDPQQEPSESVKVGTVISQVLPPGSELEKGKPFTYAVSSGPEQVQVPTVAGQPVDQAVATLAGVGLKSSQRPEESTTVAAGLVIRTDPPAGRSLARGDTVTLVVSSGPPSTSTTSAPTTTVPSTSTTTSTTSTTVVEPGP